MSAPVAVPPGTMICLRAITAAADAGEVCPTNAVLAELMGAESLATGARNVALLENLGLIVVQRTARSRVVKIVATGNRTAGEYIEAGTDGRKHAAITSEKLAIFAERLAEGDTITAAARVAGMTRHYGRLLFERLCADLGGQAA